MGKIIVKLKGICDSMYNEVLVVAIPSMDTGRILIRHGDVCEIIPTNDKFDIKEGDEIIPVIRYYKEGHKSGEFSTSYKIERIFKTGKSCPFCGEEIYVEDQSFYIIHKDNCFFTLFSSYRRHEYHISVLEQWNERN